MIFFNAPVAPDNEASGGRRYCRRDATITCKRLICNLLHSVSVALFVRSLCCHFKCPKIAINTIYMLHTAQSKSFDDAEVAAEERSTGRKTKNGHCEILENRLMLIGI